jgi:CheY-like chemotaxis protein
MLKPDEPITLLMAEDDEDYYLITKEAVDKLSRKVDFRRVEDGEELMNYLCHRGKYEKKESSPAPHIIFLDLNMPKKSGFEALKEIRADFKLKHIPVIILSISRDESDIALCYKLGANSFVTKPLGFDQLVEAIKILENYWCKTVQLPHKSGS